MLYADSWSAYLINSSSQAEIIPNLKCLAGSWVLYNSQDAPKVPACGKINCSIFTTWPKVKWSVYLELLFIPAQAICLTSPVLSTLNGSHARGAQSERYLHYLLPGYFLFTKTNWRGQVSNWKFLTWSCRFFPEMQVRQNGLQQGDACIYSCLLGSEQNPL